MTVTTPKYFDVELNISGNINLEIFGIVPGTLQSKYLEMILTVVLQLCQPPPAHSSSLNRFREPSDNLSDLFSCEPILHHQRTLIVTDMARLKQVCYIISYRLSLFYVLLKHLTNHRRNEIVGSLWTSVCQHCITFIFFCILDKVKIISQELSP